MEVLNSVAPHLKIKPEDVTHRALVCGAPERAQLIAKCFLEDAKEIAKNREYFSFRGNFKGEPILVVSHGVGASGATICFEELFRLGVQKIVRVGTAGGFLASQGIGDLVVPSGAVRLEGTSPLMISLEFPAVPDWSLTEKIISFLRKQRWEEQIGPVLSCDLFYPEKINPSPFEPFRQAGSIAVEMECSALFVLASLKKKKAASVLVLDGVVGNDEIPESYDNRPEVLREGVEKASRAALEALTDE